MTHLHAMILVVVGSVGSYLIADMLGFDFFSSIFFCLLTLLFQPFYLLFRALLPLIQVFSRKGFYGPVRVFNFFVDCVIGGVESLQWALNKLGIE